MLNSKIPVLLLSEMMLHNKNYQLRSEFGPSLLPAHFFVRFYPGIRQSFEKKGTEIILAETVGFEPT